MGVASGGDGKLGVKGGGAGTDWSLSGTPGTCKDEGAPVSAPRYARRQGCAPCARETGDLFGGAVPVPHSALGETGGGELAKFQWLLQTIKGSSPRTTS